MGGGCYRKWSGLCQVCPKIHNSPKTLPSPVLRHTSICSPRPPLSFPALVSGTLCSDQDGLRHLSHVWLCSCCLSWSRPSVSCHTAAALSLSKTISAAISILPSSFLSFRLAILAHPPASPSTHTLIHYSYFRGHLWAWKRARVCASAPFSVRRKPTFFSWSLPLSPSSSLSS